MKVLECVKTTLLASMNGYPPQLAVEFGRKVLYSNVRPSFLELENHMRQVRGAGKSE
jgi:chemotaxis protein MotA